jgi:hypothetical protein
LGKAIGIRNSKEKIKTSKLKTLTKKYDTSAQTLEISKCEFFCKT